MNNELLETGITVVKHTNITTVDDVKITVSPYFKGVFGKVNLYVQGVNISLTAHDAQSLIDTLYKSMELIEPKIFKDMVGNRLRRLSCQKCNHNWYPKQFNNDGTPVRPSQCPECQSRTWNGKRRSV